MTRARLVLLALQLVYVNLVLITGAGLRELLPRYLNVILPYFVIPIVLLVLANVAATKLFAALGCAPAKEDGPVTAFGIVAITAWLGLGLGAYLELFDYVVLELGEHAEDLDPADAPAHAGAVTAAFTSGVVAPDKVGLARQRSQVKSADVVTKIHHTYVVVPLVSAADPSAPVPVWLCRWDSGLELRGEAEVVAEALALVPAAASPSAPIRALRMRDPAIRDSCEEAIEVAEARGVRSDPEAMILRAGSDPVAELGAGARGFWLFVLIFNLVGLTPAIFVKLD